MALLNLLIGGESFREIREQNCCYVDKTAFLTELFLPIPPKVSLITRPRRFGKTLMISMLQEFLDIQKSSQAIFSGLAVSQNAALCQSWMNQYPTVFITFKDLRGENYSSTEGQVINLLRSLCIEHTYLLESEKVDPVDQERLLALKKGLANHNDVVDLLNILCRALKYHWGEPAILLIDEYDTPITSAKQNGYYEEMIVFMRNMLGAALKTNNYLKFAILTGCLRIAKESMFTGLNNFSCYSISESEYADKFGFTETEVDSLLELAGFTDKKQDFKEWYNGYNFGNVENIYCPWDILMHLNRLQRDSNAKPQTYWNNTSDNAIVKILIENASIEINKKIETLISGKAIKTKLNEDLTYDIIYKNENNV